jgi:ABC-type transport system substrate-binding protein
MIVEDGIHGQAAIYIHDQLRRVGIRMEIQPLQGDVIRQRFKDGKLIRKGNAAMEADERDHIYRELSPIFTADMPVTFLFPGVKTLVAHRRIKGLSSPESGPDPIYFIEHLWIEEESGEPEEQNNKKE